MFGGLRAKPAHGEELDNLTLIIQKIEEIQRKNPKYYVDIKYIIEPKIPIQSYAGPVDFLQKSIKLPDDDHYCQATYYAEEAVCCNKKTTMFRSRANDIRSPAIAHIFHVYYGSMIPIGGFRYNSDPVLPVSLSKKKNPLLEALIILNVKQ